MLETSGVETSGVGVKFEFQNLTPTPAIHSPVGRMLSSGLCRCEFIRT